MKITTIKEFRTKKEVVKNMLELLPISILMVVLGFVIYITSGDNNYYYSLPAFGMVIILNTITYLLSRYTQKEAFEIIGTVKNINYNIQKESLYIKFTDESEATFNCSKGTDVKIGDKIKIKYCHTFSNSYLILSDGLALDSIKIFSTESTLDKINNLKETLEEVNPYKLKET